MIGRLSVPQGTSLHPGSFGGPPEYFLGVEGSALGSGSGRGSGGGFGDALIRAHAYARAGLLNVVQLTGGMLTKAFALHFACTLPAGHTINLVDQYADDITGEQISIDGGTSPVHEGPGLGVEIDEKKVLELHAAMPKTGAWPNPRHEHDGGIADY